jgi:hypothetical protein
MNQTEFLLLWLLRFEGEDRIKFKDDVMALCDQCRDEAFGDGLAAGQVTENGEPTPATEAPHES